MTKKKIALAALILIVVACVGLIAYRYRPGPQLSKQQKAKIEAACTEIGITHINWEAKDREAGAVRYYGNFDEYDVFLLFPEDVGDEGEIGGVLRIGDTEFGLAFKECKLLGYKDDKIYTVKDLYENQIFNSEVIKQVVKQHRRYNNSLDSDANDALLKPLA